MTGRIRRPLLLWGILMAIGVWIVATQVHIQSDLSALLPEGATPTERLLLGELRAGTTGRLILMALEGDDPDRLAEASKQLARWMRDHRAFQYVGNGEQVWTKEEQDRLFQHRYQLSPGLREAVFTTGELRRALEQRLNDLASPLSPMLKRMIPADPTGEFMTVLQTWTTWTAPTKYQGVWFSSDRRRSLLLAETRAAGFDTESQEPIQTEIREQIRRINEGPADATPVHLVMAGPSVIAVEMQHTIQDDAWRLSVIAGLLVLTFLYVSYRSATLLALSLVPLASGAVAGIVAVDLTFGFIHGITLAFGVTLLGVVDDYPIHLFSHLNGESPALTVMQDIWPTMRLGVMTTAIGFSALLLSGFPGLAQLGLFAIVGLLTAAAVTRWILPHLVPAGFQARLGEVSGVRLVHLFDQLSKARLLVPLALVLAIVSLVWSDHPLWEQDLANLSPISLEKKERDQAFRTELGVPDVRDLIVVEGASEEEVLQQSEAVAPALDQLITDRVIGGHDVASRYLPSRRTQLARLTVLPAREPLEQNLAVALKGLPFQPGLFQPFLEAVEKTKTQEPVTRQTFAGTALGLKLDSLLFSREGRSVGLVPLRGVTDRHRLHDLVASWSQPHVVYLDLKEESNRMVTAYRTDALELIGWGSLSIGVVLLVGLRAPMTVLRVMIPIGCAIVVVAALLHAVGERFSLFHLASFLLVIGLGLDYALFFNRRHGTQTERGRTVYGLVVCSATTILVFGVLGCSQIPVLRAIGMTAACGSLTCLLFAALLAEEETHAA